MKILLILSTLLFTTTTFSQVKYSCSANCGWPQQYKEVVSVSTTQASAYDSLISSCSGKPLFLQAQLAETGDYKLQLATMLTACISHKAITTCHCAANCGSAESYNEISSSGSSGASAFSWLASSCTTLVFTEANLRDDREYDYTFAQLKNACYCE